MSQITPDQMRALLGYASKQLGVTPEQLAATVQNGGLSALTDRVDPRNAQRIRDMVGDPQQAEKLLQSPDVQAFLAKFLGGGGQHG